MKHEPEFKSCPFCDIARGFGNNAWVIWSDGDVCAFFPNEPMTLGHVLVIPTTHAHHLWDLDDNELGYLIRQVKLVASSIDEVIEPAGINIIQSNGVIAEQSVPHVHFHIVPRFANDPMYPIWPDSPTISRDEKDEAAQAIKSAIFALRT